MLMVLPGADGILQQEHATCYIARNFQHGLEEHDRLPIITLSL